MWPVILFCAMGVARASIPRDQSAAGGSGFWLVPADGSLLEAFRATSPEAWHNGVTLQPETEGQWLLALWASDSIGKKSDSCIWIFDSFLATHVHATSIHRQNVMLPISAAGGSHSVILLATPCNRGTSCVSKRALKPPSVPGSCLALGDLSSSVPPHLARSLREQSTTLAAGDGTFSDSTPMLALHVVREGFELSHGLAPVGGWELTALEAGALCRQEALPRGWRLPTVVGFGGSLIGGEAPLAPLLDADVDVCWLHDLALRHCQSQPRWDSVRTSAMLRLQGETLAQDLVGATWHDSNVCPMIEETSFSPFMRAQGHDWPERALTMVGTSRLGKGLAILEHLARADVRGDIVETGVWRGGASLFLASMLQSRCVALGLQADCERRSWLFDSFQGLPPTAHVDDSDFVFVNGWLAIPLDDVVGAFRRRHVTARTLEAAPPCAVRADTGTLELRREGDVVFVRGFFNESVPWVLDELAKLDSPAAECVGTALRPLDRIALLRLDGDMYTSAMDVLFGLAPLLQVGGVLFNDDFAVQGQPLAMNQFRELVGWRSPMIHVGDHQSAYYIVERRACISPAMKRWQAAGYPIEQFARVAAESGPAYCGYE